jgi:hypothetical protein
MPVTGIPTATEATDEELVLDADPGVLKKLADPATKAPEACELVRDLAGQMPHLTIDITDPPTPPCASVGELGVYGIDPDEAMQKLARTVARVLEGEDVEQLAAAADAELDIVRAEMPSKEP